jgi:mono/diheme cytochrome c family protein
MKILLLVATLLWLKGCGATLPPRPAPVAPTPVAPPQQEQQEQLALGKKLFVERCSKCHGEDGEKPFGGGPPFNERTLATDEIASAVNGRFKEKTDEEKRAVILYIQSITKAATGPEALHPSSHPD